MTSTSTTLHHADKEPRELRVYMQQFDSFCVLNVDILTDSYGHHDYDIMLPLSMLPRLSSAVDVFNTAIKATEPDIREPALVEEPI